MRRVFLDIPIEKRMNEKVEISLDELEALRLADIVGMSQNEAAMLMGISQPTFHRILREARRKAGLTILYGLKYKFKGGDHIMRRFKCYDCGYEWEEPFGTGRPKVCSKCGGVNIHRVNAGVGKEPKKRFRGGQGGQDGKGGKGRCRGKGGF